MAPFVIAILWSMVAGACLATGLAHLAASPAQPRNAAALSFPALCVSIMCLAIFELLLMRSQSPAEYGAIQRWMHVATFTTVVSMVVFVRFYFEAGRPWLAGAICGLLFVALAVNFMSPVSIEYSSITALTRIELFGESVSVPIGLANQRIFVGEAGTYLLLLYVADASFTAWRRPEPRARRRAAVVGGSLVFALAIAAVNTSLLRAGVIHSIPLYAIPFAVVLVAIGSELRADAAHSAGLAGQLVAVEGELRRSEKRLTLAAEAAGIGTWEWDITRDSLWVDPRGRALFGFAPDEPVDVERFFGALHPADRDLARSEAARARIEGGAFEREYRVVSGGHTRWVHTRGGVEREAEGAATLMRGVSFDVTSLRQAEERFRLVVEGAGNGLVMLDPKGRVTLANARAEAIFGYTRAELVTLAFDALVPGFQADRIAVAAPRLSREARGRRKDGSDVPLELGLSAIEAADGIGVLVSILDVSERARRDQELKEERAYLRQVIDIDPNLIFAKDREGRFTLANQAVADLYGTTVEALIGSTDADFNDNPDEVEAFRRADLEVMDSRRERFIAEEHITGASGRGRYLQTVKRPIMDEEGAAIQVLGVSTDVTARKEAELQLGRQRNELAHLSRVIMVAELSGSIAHELNQPLTAILSNAQAALEFIDDGEAGIADVRECLEDIVSDDKRAGQVIQGLRLMLKKGEMRGEPLDLNEVVADVLRILRSDLLSAGVTARALLVPRLPGLHGDRVQLQQVVLNLVLNACDAMAGVAPAERKLVVSTSVEGPWLRACVSDRGPGVTPESAEQMFEPFFTTKSEGLGMGLAICRNIVSAHGGRLWAEPNHGRGMTFCFTLPARAAGNPA